MNIGRLIKRLDKVFKYTHYIAYTADDIMIDARTPEVMNITTDVDIGRNMMFEKLMLSNMVMSGGRKDDKDSCSVKHSINKLIHNLRLNFTHAHEDLDAIEKLSHETIKFAKDYPKASLDELFDKWDPLMKHHPLMLCHPSNSILIIGGTKTLDESASREIFINYYQDIIDEIHGIQEMKHDDKDLKIIKDTGCMNEAFFHKAEVIYKILILFKLTNNEFITLHKAAKVSLNEFMNELIKLSVTKGIKIYDDIGVLDLSSECDHNIPLFVLSKYANKRTTKKVIYFSNDLKGVI